MEQNELVLVHDYLIQMGGAERVVAVMHKRFPKAPLYTVAADFEKLHSDFLQADIRVSWVQQIPGLVAHFKRFAPLYPFAFRSFRPPVAPIVWISSSTFSKCIRVSAQSRTICYCHNPTRFIWDPESYLKHEVTSKFARIIYKVLLPWFKAVDYRAARRMTLMVANSVNVQRRIKQFYGMESVVINPPVDVSRFQLSNRSEDFYLIVSRLSAYKRVDRAVDAFTRLKKPLYIVGTGPDEQRLRARAGPTIRFFGRLSDGEVTDLMQRCRAFVFAGEEDFGITPVEAQACGKPVLAFGAGGALETIKPGESGWFFYDENGADIEQTLGLMESTVWVPERIRLHAEQFSEARFLEKMTAVMRS